MTALLNFVRRPGDSSPMYVGPEDIVREAERLGKLKIEEDWGTRAYKAQIRFNNRNGSTV